MEPASRRCRCSERSPAIVEHTERAMNWAQVRARIDRGETGDKEAAPDPATVPLGTDAEAGGTPTASEHVARSFAAERSGPGERAAAQGRAVPARALVGLG